MKITSGKVVRFLFFYGSMLFLHHCSCTLLGLKAQHSAELCPSFVNCNHFWCLILTGWGRTGNGILAEIGDSRGMGEERARGGSTKRIGSGRIWQQCLIFCNENKEQGGSQKQNKK